MGIAIYCGFKFKEDILKYALSKIRNIVQDRWDKRKLSFKCGIGGKCNWKVYCFYKKPRQCWLAKTRYKFNSCTSNEKCELLKNLVISKIILDKLRKKSGLIPAKVQEKKRTFGSYLRRETSSNKEDY